MDTIIGIEIYPIIALLIFFVFFVGLITWTFTYRKEAINELSMMPLEDEVHANDTNQLKQ